MWSAARTRFLVITGAVALTAILYFLPQKLTNKDSVTDQEKSTFSFDALLESAKGSLKREELDPVKKLEATLEKDKSNLVLLDSLGKVWDRLQQPIISAHYFEVIAGLQPGEKTWLNAAYRYFDAAKIAGDTSLRNSMVSKAIASYNNVLSYNPENLDAKTDLGACYVDGTNEPMKGILLLREVVQKNPNHENAQYNLGILSVKSGQYPKAIERFQKVLEINPSRKEMYYLIGKTYRMMGENQKALENLERLKKETSDVQLIEETNSLINQINTNH
ncbi:MAG: tetratricopeptide repeat protein [Bacteroidetes bacterium]|nr:tetratricopeptide repeat protein [Bacteroidota bacterium]